MNTKKNDGNDRQMQSEMRYCDQFDLQGNQEDQIEQWEGMCERALEQYNLGEHEFAQEFDRIMNATGYSDQETGNESGGAPTKETLHNVASQLTAHNAIAEFIDNIFDNYIYNLKEEIIDTNLIIRIDVFYEAGNYHYIRIRENSGGISKAKFDAINTPGISIVGGGNSVSTYGQGTKISLAALSSDNKIGTNHITELDPVHFHYPPSYYVPTDTKWKIRDKKIDSGFIFDNLDYVIIPETTTVQDTSIH